MHRGRQEQTAPPLSEFDLQRYIRLARSFQPRITPEARTLLVRCYKKLREDRTYVRGAAGVTVRQLESLIRLSEAIARVYLDVNVRAEHVQEAYTLQVSTLKALKRESVDLGEDLRLLEGEAAEAAGGAAAAAAPGEGAPKAAPRRVRISFAEYQRISHLLIRHLADKEQVMEEVKECDLMAWYLEQMEEQITTEAQLLEQQHLVQLVITRLIEKDRVVLVYRASDDPARPERRVLVKHPNYSVDETVIEPMRPA